MHPLRIDTLFIKQHHFGKIGNTKTYDQSMNHFNKELCFVRELPFSLKKVVTVCYYFLVKKNWHTDWQYNQEENHTHNWKTLLGNIGRFTQGISGKLVPSDQQGILASVSSTTARNTGKLSQHIKGKKVPSEHKPHHKTNMLISAYKYGPKFCRIATWIWSGKTKNSCSRNCCRT